MSLIADDAIEYCSAGSGRWRQPNRFDLLLLNNC